MCPKIKMNSAGGPQTKPHCKSAVELKADLVNIIGAPSVGNKAVKGGVWCGLITLQNGCLQVNAVATHSAPRSYAVGRPTEIQREGE